MKMPIPNDWDGQAFCRYAVCWPDSPLWKIVLRGLLTEPTRGYFWDERTGSIVGVLAQIRQTMDYNLKLREVIMACEDQGLQDIAKALSKIALAMSQSNSIAVTQGCCPSGSGGGGQYPAPPSPNEEGDPLIDPPPDGFESWEEFFQQKCAIAYDIVSKVIDDLQSMTVWAIGASVSIPLLTELATVLLTLTISSGGIAAIVALLISVGSAIVVSTMLNVVSSNQEALVCALYNGVNSQDSRQAFIDRFTLLLDEGPFIEPVEKLIMRQLIMYMLDTGETNRLYDKDNARVWGEQDCSTCDPCDISKVVIEEGTVVTDETSNGTRHFVIDSVVGDIHVNAPYLVHVPPQNDGCFLLIESINVGSANGYGGRLGWYFDHENVYHNLTNINEINGQCINQFAIYATVNFTLTVDISRCL